MKSEIISVETKYKWMGPFLGVSVRLPDGEFVQREIEDHGNAVAVLAFDPNEKWPLWCNSSGLRRYFRWGKNIRSKRSPAL